MVTRKIIKKYIYILLLYIVVKVKEIGDSVSNDIGKGRTLRVRFPGSFFNVKTVCMCVYGLSFQIYDRLIGTSTTQRTDQ